MTPQRARTLVLAPPRWAWWLLRVTLVTIVRGAARLARVWHQWRTVAGDRADRDRMRDTLGPGDGKTFESKNKSIRRTRAERTRRSWAAAVGVPDALLLVAWWTGAYLLVPAVAAAVLLAVCLAAGATPHRRPADTATPAPEPPETGHVTRPMVLDALASLGITKLDKALAANPTGKGWFPRGIHRDGPGYRAEVELPPGVTVPNIASRREELASALRQPLGCVWIEPSEQHAGRVVLWIGDQELSKASQPAWPLSEAGRFDLFRPVPFGMDVRGRPVGVPLIESNLLIGAIMGAGKTIALRLTVLAAALDPRCELRLFNLKGTNDLAPLERVAADYGSGADDDTLEACLDSLRQVHADLNRRAKVIRDLPLRRCPESKVTPELAADRSLGLHPLLVVVDELQELMDGYKSPKNKTAAEAARLATAIIKRGRALGVILILATQRPDEQSMPMGVRSNVGTRFCLRVTDQPANDMVLGAGAYARGIRATELKPDDRGVGFLVGAADEPQVVRTYHVDLTQAEEIATRAAQLRGHRPDSEPDDGVPDAPPTVADPVVLAALDSLNGDRAVGLADLLDRMQGAGHCCGWDTQRLGTELAARGVARPEGKRRLEPGGVPVRWVGREHLEAAL